MYHEFLYQIGLFRLDDRFSYELSVIGCQYATILHCMNHDLGEIIFIKQIY